MAEIIISVASRVAEYMVAPIERQLGYLFNYQCNLDELKKQVEELGIAMGSRQRDVDDANRQGEEIEPAVQKWLTDTAVTIETAKKFIEEEEAAKKSCFNVKARYQRSREAKRQSRVIVEEIQKNNQFHRVSHLLQPQRTWSTCLRGIETFKTRAKTLNQIMEALKSDENKLIGVWGMGGVGKTTLANQVMKVAKEDKLFDEVVMASNISQIPNLSNIQADIACMLGLEFKENEHELVRAERIRKCLQKHKRVLVILDDLWEELSLEKIGIPCGAGREGCKLLLTSRNLHLLSNLMGTHKNFEVQQLSNEEAWNLFNKYLATGAAGDPESPPEAREVAEKCDGLPIAIVTIAKALKGKGAAVWRNALEELKRAEPTNIPGVSEKVYSCLELSYNYLKGDEVKHLFLLCGMLRSGYISMGPLLHYALGLDLFQHNLSFQQASDKLVTLVKNLKDSSLLLDTEDEYSYWSQDHFLFEPDEIMFIRMHDVVRDVARSIASKDPHQFVLKEAGGFEEWQRRDDELINCTHLSLINGNIQRLPERLVCPKLQFFFLQDCGGLKIPDTFFEEMKQLKVLHLQNMDLPVLPPSLNALSSLQSLCLTECRLGDVEIIGALKKLRVLSFEESYIKQLPQEMMQLNDLRVLDLWSCHGLRVIPRNVISSLSRLEFLCVDQEFTEWGAKRFDNGETNACLSELRNLSNLKTLVINTGNLNRLPKDIVFDSLNRYQIVVGCDWPDDEDDDKRYSRVLKLDGIKSGYNLVSYFSKLFKTTEVLQLRELDGSEQTPCEFDGEGFPKLKHLCIEESDGIQYVGNSMEWVPSRYAFPILESLDLDDLSNLDAVWYGPIPKGTFGHLRELRLSQCWRLKYVMLLFTTQEREFVFPHLKDIGLESLPELINFCSIKNSLIKDSSTTSDAQKPFFNPQVALPGLESLCMHGLDEVGTFWQDQIHAGSFRKLKRLEISHCNRLRDVYLLRSLETLRINNCYSLDEIFEVEDSNEEIHDIAAAPLRELYLESLPRLRSTWYKQDPQEWASLQNLRVLKVWDCRLVTHLFPATIAKGLGNLEVLHVGDCEVEEIVADENGEIATPSLFPRLTSLKLDRLGKLRCIYRGTSSRALQWPLLKDLQVCNCGKVEVIFQGIGSEADVHSAGAQQPLFFVQKDTFPNLEKLTLTDTTKTWQGQFSDESFGKLQHLEVTECNDISAVMSSTIIPKLSNVKHLKLDKCN